MEQTYHIQNSSKKIWGIICIILGLGLLLTALVIYLKQGMTWNQVKRYDSSGFGYQIQLPSGWHSQKNNVSNASSGLNTEFYQNCSGNKSSSLKISFIFLEKPEAFVNSIVNNLKKIGYQEKSITVSDGKNINRYSLAGSKEITSYLTVKDGYFIIQGTNGCNNLDKLYDMIFKTFKLL
jgi:hypothetical protein